MQGQWYFKFRKSHCREPLPLTVTGDIFNNTYQDWKFVVEKDSFGFTSIPDGHTKYLYVPKSIKKGVIKTVGGAVNNDGSASTEREIVVWVRDAEEEIVIYQFLKFRK